MAVACHPGLRVHDRLAPPDDAVEERRLAHVGAADDGDGRNAHNTTAGAAEAARLPTVAPLPPLSPANASTKSYDSPTGTGSCAAISSAPRWSMTRWASIT